VDRSFTGEADRSADTSFVDLIWTAFARRLGNGSSSAIYGVLLRCLPTRVLLCIGVVQVVYGALLVTSLQQPQRK